MNPTNSSTLFHFTRKFEYLKGILEKGFRYSYSFEPFPSRKKRSRGCAIPMICLCDIPLTRTSEHFNKYGKYCIGLDKYRLVADLKEHINPVLYLSSIHLQNNILELRATDKWLSTEICSCVGISNRKLNNLCDDIYDYDKVSSAIESFEGYCVDEYSRYLENQKTLYYLLGYYKTIYTGSKHNNFNNYDEREWRIIALFSPKEKNWIIDVTKNKFDKIRTELNNNSSYLVISPSHFSYINFIIVDNKIELEILTEFILSTEMLFGTKIGFSKTDMKKRYSLISKLTSFERIEKDF